MKTLGVLLLLAIALGGAYWTTQRPGEGVDALAQDARAALERVQAGIATVRDGAASAGATASEQTTAALDDARSDIVAARSEMDASSQALSARIDALENELTRTMTSTEANVVQGRLDTLDERIAELADAESAEPDALADEGLVRRLDAIDGKLELLDRRLEQDDPTDRIDGLESELARLADRLDDNTDALSAGLSAARAERASLQEGNETLGVRMASLLAGGGGGDTDAEPVALDAALDQRLAALETALAGGRADRVRMDEINARLNGLGEQLDALDASDTSSSAALAGLAERLDALSADSQALSIDNVQQQIRDQLANLDAEVEAGAEADQVSELTESLDATRERIKQLETQVQGLPASSSAGGRAQENQSALESQIAALTRRIETLPQTPDEALVSSIDAVRERVEELDAKGFVTQEELRAQSEGESVEYKIYFDKNATEITDEAARVLDSFIAQETNRTTGVSIFGFTDRRGPASYNQQLAQRRAANVRSYLIQNGFDYTKIGNVSGLGEDAAAALLEDEQEDAQQRVVVLFAAQR